MAYEHEHLLSEIGNAAVYADIDYQTHPSCGDGWNEPREPAHAEILKVTLRVVTRRAELCQRSIQNPQGWRHVYTHTKQGDAPDWIVDLLQADDDLMAEMLAEAGEEEAA